MLGIAILAVGAHFGGSGAEPLAKEACETLKTEQDTLVTGGIKDELAKGPDWAKSNLKPARLQEIARYIELEEHLNFRCGQAKAKLIIPEEPPPDPATAAKGEAAAVTPKAKGKSKAKPKPKAAEAPGAETPATTTQQSEAPESPARPAAAAKSRSPAAPKPKVDDAYRPPAPANPDTDPFAKQLAPKG